MQQKTIKVIVAGGRDFANYMLLCRKLLSLLRNYDFKNVEIVSGCAKGADKLGERFAKEFGCKIKRFPAQWDIYGKAAGYRRNFDMADYVGKGQACVVFWDGMSRGTRHMINIAKQKKLNLRIINYRNEGAK